MTPLKDVLAEVKLTRKEKVLACLSESDGKPLSTSRITDIAVQAGLRAAAKWNVSALLGSLQGDVVRTPSGWELTASGTAKAKVLRGIRPPPAVSNLRNLLPHIREQATQEFLAEAIACYEDERFRAAVVLAWVGAMATLYDKVIRDSLKEFNDEATRRDAKWRLAKNADGLARMGEYEFLQILESMSMIGRGVKLELEGCLKLRNGCGHPNTLKVKAHRAASHLELLIENVFAVF